MKRFVRAAFTASLLCATVGASSLLGAASAQAADDKGDKVGPAVGKPLSEAQKAIQAKDYASALADIKLAQAVPSHTPIEDYRINQFLSIVAFNLKDIPTATTAIQAAADSPALPTEDKTEIYTNALILSSASSQYQKAVGYGQQLAALAPLNADLDMRMALAYYELKDTAHAQEFAQKSIDAAKAAGTAPDPNALRIVMNGQAQNNDRGGVETTLETLVLADPDNSANSWRDLVNLAFGQKGANEIDAIFLYRLKVLAGAMTDADDYTTLASTDEQLGYPTEAVAALEKGIASGKISAGQVGELMTKGRRDAAGDSRDLPQIVASAEKSKTGEQEIKLGEDYWGYSRFADAETAARRAIAKGGLKRPTEGNLLLGAALVAQGKYDEGIQTLGQVGGTPSSMKVAHLWTLYAQAKLKQAPASPAPATPPAH